MKIITENIIYKEEESIEYRFFGSASVKTPKPTPELQNFLLGSFTD